MAMRQNITVSIEKELIAKSKLLAAQRDTSISKMLAQELNRLIQTDEHFQRSKKAVLSHLRKEYHLGGKKVASREELHER